MDNSLNESESPDFESLAQVGVNIHSKSSQIKIISMISYYRYYTYVKFI